MASQQLLNAQKLLEQRRKQEGINYRPVITLPAAELPTQPTQGEPEQPETAVSLPDTVKAYPTLQTAFGAAGHDQLGRLYLLLLALDQGGRGMVDHAALRAADSRTWRHTRRVLERGHGIAWDNDKKRARVIRYAPHRVMINLDGGWLRGAPVAFPVSALVDGMQAYRAYCLAAWHTSINNPSPLTRQTIREATGACESSQRAYDKIAATQAKLNYAIDDTAPYDETKQDLMYKRWGGVFRFYDFNGKYTGKRGAYSAWRMPNSYQASLATLPKGRQKKHNRQINLVINGTRGNSRKVVRIYHLDGSEAGKAYNRHPDLDHYVRAGDSVQPKAEKPSKLAGAAMWQYLAKTK